MDFVTCTILAAFALGQPNLPNSQVSALPPSPTVSAQQIVVAECLVTLVEEVQVPAQTSGVIASLEARPGMMVDKGFQLARQDDAQVQLKQQDAEFTLEIAKRQATNSVHVRHAKKAWEVAKAELEQKEHANTVVTDSVPLTELRRYRLAEQRASLEIEKAQEEAQIAKLTADAKKLAIDLNKLAIEKHLITSPIHGVVAEIYRRPGEWVNPGDPVMKLIRIDRLRIEGYLNIKHVGPEVAGCLVTATIELPGGRKVQVPGKIVFTSPNIEPVTGEFRVWAEILNPNMQFLPGMRASMVIHRQQKAMPQVTNRPAKSGVSF